MDIDLSGVNADLNAIKKNMEDIILKLSRAKKSIQRLRQCGIII